MRPSPGHWWRDGPGAPARRHHCTGFWLGLIPPAILALLGGGWQLLVAVLAVYIPVNFVFSSLVQPRFVGNAVDLSMTVTLVALVFWAWVLGPIGAVLAIPLT